MLLKIIQKTRRFKHKVGDEDLLWINIENATPTHNGTCTQKKLAMPIYVQPQNLYSLALNDSQPLTYGCIF